MEIFQCTADYRGSPILKFVTQPTDVIAAEQSTVTIPCVARSSSKVTYKWIHNGTELKLSSSSGRYKLTEPAGNLTVINIAMSDVGTYRCIANTRFGSALSLKAELRVACEYH